MTTETFDDADAQIARLSNELDKAREVLLEMDKIVAGHVTEVERLETELAAQTELSGSALDRCAELAERLTGLRALNAEMLAALKIACGYASTERRKEFETIIAKAEGQS